ncbi:MAG: glutamine-hydrolyzing carbamoyl-phosphate synthase small subunit [Candidatus Neomarinimicrobiota bacterium]
MPAVLLLEDGRFFNGYSFGATGEAVGEVCFNTSFSGYQEILTDPSYRRQIVTMTSPHIGNYGVNSDDVESGRIQVAGLIVRELTDEPSNWRSTGKLNDYLKDQNIVGLQGLDTRALTRHIRDCGAMNGIISTVNLDPSALTEKLAAVTPMTGLDLAAEVTCESAYAWPVGANQVLPRYRVIAIDFGIKYNILRLLAERGCDVTILPASASATDILAARPDGVFLSNGPGDPAAVDYAIATVRSLLGRVPLFGICLGHQILALALGCKTFKLKFGHRGSNHPVKDLMRGIVEITSQNHGFAVAGDSLPEAVSLTHINLNDNTVEGLACRDLPAFSVQYHPEASPGPHDSRYLFDRFINLMKNFAGGA